MNPLPHRYSPNSVNRFIPILRSMIDRHKAIGGVTIEFDPSNLGLNVNTAIARLRDAVHSFSHKLVSDELINPDELITIWPHYRLVPEMGLVLIQPLVKVQDTEIRLGTFPTTISVTLVSDLPNFAETLSELASLLGKRILQGEVIVEGNLPDGLQETLEAKNDIIISQIGHQQHRMI